MQKIKIAGTGIQVSPLSYGTAGFGTTLDQNESFYQMDAYKDVGGNFIDTAHVYGMSPKSSEPHASEAFLGRWLTERKNRSEIVISTKGAHPLLTDPAFRPRLSKREVESDLNESLAHLKTDYIDLYFLHRDDPSIPVEEIIETMEGFKKEGKILNYGFSNWKTERAREAYAYSRKRGYAGFTVNQLMWSLAHVTHEEITDKTLVAMDKDMYAWHKETGTAAMAYRSIAKGYFTKKYLSASIRNDLKPVFETDINDRIYNTLLEISKETGLGITLLSLMYFLYQPFPAIAIASFSSRAQLEEGLTLLTHQPNEEISRRLQALRCDLNA